MKMMPLPIITIMKMDMVMEPEVKHWIYGIYGDSWTISRRGSAEVRALVFTGSWSDPTTCPIGPTGWPTRSRRCCPR
jgi:hypothetical protein